MYKRVKGCLFWELVRDPIGYGFEDWLIEDILQAQSTKSGDLRA